MDQSIRPYRSTPVFDQTTLPRALRQEHSTRAGVWGVIRIHSGRLQIAYPDDGIEAVLDPQHPGLVKPEQKHFVTPLGAMQMQIDFYDRLPASDAH
ncbi:DUF1971 domain-containing protein [Hyphomicrobium sulfonivorans]|uniref:DUF1971 domain-containing protein n=1 Tax=Hyphomicrobium sulfonivorans TaxID=121290 RepID=UPI00156DC412|nr:DUF1971 domain-containing protein [Hyphomicrobium sulfonivorans]MBI1649573.1 DUF1971 domain-containing protein [Hyphomicrobium sulfonivorans]NSL71489.1 hypothetical protein [Hyphomicrobium sulfonivorans]